MNIWEFLGKAFIVIIILVIGMIIEDSEDQKRAQRLKNTGMPLYTIDGEDLYIVTKNNAVVDKKDV